MDMMTVFRIPLEEKVFESFLYYVNQNHIEQYIVKRSEALEDFAQFLSNKERKVIKNEEWIKYVVFYVDKGV